MEEEDNGSMLIGGLLGFFLGCIGLIVALFVLNKPDTKKGAFIGFGLSVVMGLCFGGLAIGAQLFLMNS